MLQVGDEQRRQKELEELRAEIRSEFDHMQSLIEEDADMEVCIGQIIRGIGQIIRCVLVR